MGKILKALSPQSSYAARKTDIWSDLMDELEQCMVERDLDEYEVRVEGMVLRIPVAWKEPLEEAIEKKREELRSENIGQIMLDKYDF